MQSLFSISEAALQQIKEDLTLLHSCISDAHIAAVSTPWQCAEGVARHVVNYFALIPPSSLSTEDSRDGGEDEAIHRTRTDAILHLMISSEISLVEFVKVALIQEQGGGGTTFGGAGGDGALTSPVGKAVKECLATLSLLVEVASRLLSRRQCEALRRCAFDTFLLLSRVGVNQAAQAEALTLLVRLLDAQGGVKLTHSDFDIARTLETVERNLGKSSCGQTVKSITFQLLGKMTFVFPAECTSLGKRISELFLKAMRSMSEKAEPEHTVGEGLLVGMDSLLRNFGEGLLIEFPAPGSSTAASTQAPQPNAALLYNFVKCALQVAERTPRYQFPKAALRIVKHHSLLFREILTRDAMSMFELLRRLCGHKNVELHKAAYPAATAFLQAISFHLCEERKAEAASLSSGGGIANGSQSSAAVLQGLLDATKQILMHREQPYELSFAISAYGALSKPIALFVGVEDMSALFTDLSSRCELLFNQSQSEMESSSRHLPQFLTTYAALILEMNNVTSNVRDAVETLVDTTLLLFPKHFYFPKVRLATPAALMKLFIACSKHELLSGMHEVFVQRGVALSMGSSRMYSEEAARGSEVKRDDDGALYEEYAPLWRALMLLKKDRDEWGYPWSHYVDDEAITFHIGEMRRALLNAVVISLQSFDMECAVMGSHAVHSGPVVAGTESHHLSLAAAEGLIGPRSPKDYTLFLNLTQFFCSIAPTLLRGQPGDAGAQEDQQWTSLLMQTLVDLSCKHPHVSGYYTMLTSILRHSRRQILSSKIVIAIVLPFYRLSLKRLADYSHELLFSCASCLLSYPTSIVSLRDQSLSISIIFRLGVEHEPAAVTALEALERWMAESPLDTQRYVLPCVLPFIKVYAEDNRRDSTGSSLDDVDVDRKRSGDRSASLFARVSAIVGREGLRLAAAMRSISLDGTSELNSVTGSTPSSALLTQVADSTREAQQKVSVDAERSLRLVLPLRDCLVEFPVGRILPRVIYLASSAASRSVRVAACELFHSLALWVVGTMHTRLADSTTDPTDALTIIFPAVAQLASSTDGISGEIFHALLLQLTHWFAQVPCDSTQQSAKGPSILLDALFHGLVQGGGNAGHRNVCSHAISEFLHWSRKNVADRGALNARLIMRRLSALFHHPGVWERLGAAVCFNKLYTEFREMDDNVLSEHTLDLLYHCFSALLLEPEDSESGVVGPMKESLLHVEKILVYRSKILLNADERRGGLMATLQDAVMWLFEQCGSVQKMSRSIAMRLFTTLSSCLPGFESEDGPSRWLTMAGHKTDIFQGVFFAFSLSKVENISDPKFYLAHRKFIEWTKEIEASVSCHLWLLSARYLAPHIAFGRRGGQELKRRRAEAVMLGGTAAAYFQQGGSPSPQHGGSLLPKSQLLLHLWGFFVTCQQKGKVSTHDKEESQAEWIGDEDIVKPKVKLEDNDDEGEVDVEFESASNRRLSVLESAASLLETITDRFPSALWCESDEEVCEGTVKPLLHKALYSVVATICLNPKVIFGSLAFAAAFRDRIHRVGQRLMKVVWSAVHGFCPQEMAPFCETTASAIPFNIQSLPACVAAAAAHPLHAVASLQGFRTLVRIGALPDVLQRSMGVDKTRFASALFAQVRVYLRENRDFISGPTARVFFQELLTIICESGLDVDSFLEAIFEDKVPTPSYATPAPSATSSQFDIRRLSTSVQIVRDLHAQINLWFTYFRPTVESFCVSHADTVLLRCAEELRVTARDGSLSGTSTARRRTCALELMTLMFRKISQMTGELDSSEPRGLHATPQPAAVALPLGYWDKLHTPCDGSQQSLELLDFRLSVVPFVVSANAVPSVARYIIQDVMQCLNPTWAFAQHTLLHSRSAVKWLRCACDVAVSVAPQLSVEQRSQLFHQLDTAFVALIINELPLSWKELDRSSTSYECYLDVVSCLFDTLQRAPPSIASKLMFSLLPLLQHKDHPLRSQMLQSIQVALSKMATNEVLAVAQQCLLKQREPLPISVRQAITFHVVLPCLRQLPQQSAHALFTEHVSQLFQQADKIGFAAGTADIINMQCVHRTCAFVMLQVMYRLCSPDALKGAINNTFIGSEKGTGKELTEKLLRLCIAARSFAPPVLEDTPVDAGLLLQYRQAAYSCLVSVVTATQRQEKLFVQFLLREKNRDLWHCVVDLNMTHNFTVETRFFEVEESIAMLRSDLETAGGAAADNVGSESGVVSTEPRSGVKKVKYLSSQYMQDSHIPHGMQLQGSTPPSQPPAPPSGRSKDNGDMDEAIQVSATPRQHRDSIMASIQMEIEQSKRLRQEPDGPRLLPASVAVDDFLQGAPNSQADSTTGSIEIDSVWRSACCNSILHLIDVLIRTFPTVHQGADAMALVPQSQGAAAATYSWVHEIIALLRSSDCHINVKLVFARMILLRPLFFEQFATDLFEPLVAVAITGALGKGTHYFLRDIVLLLLRWKAPLPPYTPAGESSANSLISHLIRNVTHRTRRIIRENLEILKLITEKWKGRVHVSKKDLLGWIAYEDTSEGAQSRVGDDATNVNSAARLARLCGIQICGILAANSIPFYVTKYDLHVVAEEVFYKKLVQNFSFGAKEIAAAAAEVAGMGLKVLQAASTTADDRTSLLRSIVTQKLNQMYQSAEPERFLLILRRVAENFPDIVDEFVPGKLAANFFASLPPESQATVLEILGIRASRANQIYPTLHALVGYLRTMRSLLKTALYELLLLLSPHLTSDLLQNLISTFLSEKVLVQHLSTVVDARVAFYNMCISLYDNRQSDIPLHTRDLIRIHLVRGLDDPSLFIRDLLIKFWDHESRLPLEGTSRFENLFSKLCVTTSGATPFDNEEGSGGGDAEPWERKQVPSSWLQHGAILMLSLCHRNPDFQRSDSLFKQPLKNCTFKSMFLDRSRNTTMTPSLLPMFSSQVPVARLLRPPQSLSGTGRDETTMDNQPAAPLGFVAATQQNRLFPSTQQGQFTTFERSFAPPESQSSLLFTVPSTQRRQVGAEFATPFPFGGEVPSGATGESVVLRKRFFRVEEDDLVRRHIVHASRLRQQRDVLQEQLAQEKQSKVVVFRAYRDGEVPDIQITLQAIVVPLQALCLHDTVLSHLTLSSIGEAILTKVYEAAGATPTGGGQALRTTAAAPTATFLIDVPGALTAHNARAMCDRVHGHLLRCLDDATHLDRSILKFVHEMLLLNSTSWGLASRSVNQQARPATSPQAILSSCVVGSGSESKSLLHSALLILEHHLETLSVGTRDEATESKLDVAWAFYYLGLRRLGHDDLARVAATKFIALGDVYHQFLEKRDAGDFEGAVQCCTQLQKALSAALPSGQRKSAVISTIQQEARDAMVQMLRWDDVAQSFSSGDEKELLAGGASNRLHELRHLVWSHTILATRSGAGEYKLPFHPSTLPPGMFALEKAMCFLQIGDVHGAAVAAKEGMLQGMSQLDDVDSLQSLHHLTALLDLSTILSTVRISPPDALRRLERLMTQFGQSTPQAFSEAPQAWDTAVAVLELINSKSREEIERTTRSELPLEFVRSCNAVVANMCLKAGDQLSHVRGTSMAAKRLMSKASSLTPDNDPEARFRAWAAVAQSTIQRFRLMPPNRGTNIRQLWGDLQHNINGKREGSKATATLSRLFLGIECALWNGIASAILTHEGVTPSNQSELTEVIHNAGSATKSYSVMISEEQSMPSSAAMEVVHAAHEQLFTLLEAAVSADHLPLLPMKAQSQLATMFTQTLIGNMESFQSQRARELIPRLLELMHMPKLEGVREAIESAATTMSTYNVLPWAAQLISSLVRPGGGAIAGLLKRMAMHHPQVVYYPFHCVKEDLLKKISDAAEAKVSESVKQVIGFLSDAFDTVDTLGNLRLFTSNLIYFHNPELRAKYWVTLIGQVATRAVRHAQGDSAILATAQRQVQALFDKLFVECFDVSARSGKGRYNRKYAEARWPEVKKLFCLDDQSCPPTVKPIAAWVQSLSSVGPLISAVVDPLGVHPLSSFSETIATLNLGTFSNDYVEIPQQSFQFLRSKCAVVIPRVVAIDANVLVLSSIQRPKRILLFGSDESSHWMLVKGGDDLRLDQRIQQLFFAINGVLARGVPLSGSSSLSIRTYSVIPVTKRIGMVQWVTNTAVLKEVIEAQMSLAGGKLRIADHRASGEYHALFESSKDKGWSNYLLNYQDMPNRNNEYSDRIQRIIEMIYPYYLRDGLQRRCPDISSFYSLRHRFALSLSALSMASYVLGIGDRHLDNFLVDKSTGELLAIDFGHSFGAATTSLPVPELIPFRLTPQMVNCLGPLGTDGLVAPMTQTLDAILKHKSLIACLVESFLHEPLLDWEHASQLRKEKRPFDERGREGELSQFVAGADVAEGKLGGVRRKMALENPVLILESELAQNNCLTTTRYAERVVVKEVQKVARGDPKPRCSLSSANVGTSREFVEILIDLATDKNVLGRTWGGWNPLF